MSILDKAKRHNLLIKSAEGGVIHGARMTEDEDGVWVRTDDPILLAMEKVCKAAMTWPNGPVGTRSMMEAIEKSQDLAEDLKDALFALQTLTEDKP